MKLTEQELHDRRFLLRGSYRSNFISDSEIEDKKHQEVPFKDSNEDLKTHEEARSRTPERSTSGDHPQTSEASTPEKDKSDLCLPLPTYIFIIFYL